MIGKLTEQWNHDSNLLRHHTEKVDFFKGYKNRSSYYPTNATGMQVLARRGGAAASDAKTAGSSQGSVGMAFGGEDVARMGGLEGSI